MLSERQKDVVLPQVVITGHTSTKLCIQSSEDNLWNSTLVFYHVSPKNQTDIAILPVDTFTSSAILWLSWCNLTGLSLCRSSVGNYSCCHLLWTMAMSSPEEIMSSPSTPYSRPYVLSSPSFWWTLILWWEVDTDTSLMPENSAIHSQHFDQSWMPASIVNYTAYRIIRDQSWGW